MELIEILKKFCKDFDSYSLEYVEKDNYYLFKFKGEPNGLCIYPEHDNDSILSKIILSVTKSAIRYSEKRTKERIVKEINDLFI